jgi:hypothetical protein
VRKIEFRGSYGANICREKEFKKWLSIYKKVGEVGVTGRARICKCLKSPGIDSARLGIDSWTP